MAYYVIDRVDYRISTDPGELNWQVIQKNLSEESYWPEGIPLETVEKE